jgi:hypothetical protein
MRQGDVLHHALLRWMQEGESAGSGVDGGEAGVGGRSRQAYCQGVKELSGFALLSQSHMHRIVRLRYRLQLQISRVTLMARLSVRNDFDFASSF